MQTTEDFFGSCLSSNMLAFSLLQYYDAAYWFPKKECSSICSLLKNLLAKCYLLLKYIYKTYLWWYKFNQQQSQGRFASL